MVSQDTAVAPNEGGGVAQVAAAARFRRHPRRYPTQRVRHRTLRRVPWVHPCTTQAGKHARPAAEWTSPIAQLPCSSDMRLLPHANFGIPNFAETPASSRFHCQPNLNDSSLAMCTTHALPSSLVVWTYRTKRLVRRTHTQEKKQFCERGKAIIMMELPKRPATSLYGQLARTH